MTSAVTTTPPPPPAPATPPPLTPGGRTAVRVLLVVAASVLVIGTVAGLGVSAFGLSALRVTNDTSALPAGMRSLTIDTTGSPAMVHIVADRNAAEPRVDLRQVDSTRSAQAALNVVNDGAGTKVSFSGPHGAFMDWHRGGELTVTLPPALAQRLSVTVQQEDGALRADADLDQLIARMSDGAVFLSGSARRIEIDSRDGAVVTRDPISVTESIRVDSRDGKVGLDFKDAPPRTVDVTARDGSIAIALPAPGPYLVNASTGDRDAAAVVRVPQTSDRKAAAGVVTVRADDGDVDITTLGRGEHE
ncbi:hypothetical protein [Mycobacterium sp. URHB0044]|uniref:hypothetical protein n=1 Tax=Mycobacterium sp. URHB0044 TaxID=1380386 RepID=UPI00048E8A8A|nr:hypothetical protein [Mycobacterium sp. URHB0044]